LVAASLLVTLLAGGVVSAQAPTADPAALLSRIEFLERQVRVLGERVRAPVPGSAASAGGETGTVTGEAGGAAAARLSVRISDLEQELRAITGRMEEVSFQVRRLNERLDRLASDVEFRMSQQGGSQARPQASATGPGQDSLGAGAAGLGATAAPPQTGAAGPRVLGTLPASELDKPKADAERPRTTARAEEAPAAAPPPAPPAAAVEVPPPAPSSVAVPGPQASSREQYAYAFGLMQRQKYPESQQAFQDFLKKHPADPLAENASYWLGESYYAQGDYTRAATTFLETYEKHKSGAKAPDTLLKLGMALGQLKKTKEACATFQELNKAFPNAPTSVKARANEEKRRLGCG
jgi:tol-pal system protein YbgF